MHLKIADRQVCALVVSLLHFQANQIIAKFKRTPAKIGQATDLFGRPRRRLREHTPAT
jgi:hypothetical protein